jgi:hypothetical protein
MSTEKELPNQAISYSLLFTWSIESVLISFLGIGLNNCFQTLSIFIVSVVSCFLYVALASQDYGQYMNVVAIGHVCVVTGNAISSLFDINSISSIINVCLGIIHVVIAFGMVFATKDKTTFLFLNERGHYAIAMQTVLTNLYCLRLKENISISHFDMSELGIIWSFFVICINFAPYNFVAHIGNFVLQGGMGLWFWIIDRNSPSIIIVITNAITLTYFLNEWMPVILMFLFNYKLPDLKLITNNGPWIETIIFALIIIVSFVLIVVFAVSGQVMFSIILVIPIMISAVWISVFWIKKPVQQSGTAQEVSVTTTQKELKWPRVHFTMKDL